MIEGDDSDREVVTNGAPTALGNTSLMHARSHTETTRHIWAIVYRCPDDVHPPSDDSQ